MSSDNGRGVYVVVFRDNEITVADPGYIVVPHGHLASVAHDLATKYGRHFVGGQQPNSDYLIAGTIVKTSRIGEPDAENRVNELSFVCETKVGIELLAGSFNLPTIPEDAYARFSSD